MDSQFPPNPCGSRQLHRGELRPAQQVLFHRRQSFGRPIESPSVAELDGQDFYIIMGVSDAFGFYPSLFTIISLRD